MTNVDTRVTAVSVYPDRARVTRAGEVELKQGSHRLEFSELPLVLDAASVRAAARGTAEARLLGVDVKREFYEETPAEQVRELEKQVEALQDEASALSGRATLLQEERQTVRGLAEATGTYARGLAYGKTTAADQIALLDKLRQRAGEIDGELLELAVEERERERRLSKLKRELDQLRGGAARERYVAVVEVEVVGPGKLTVELTYVVSGAGWQPLYDLRLLEEGEPALEVGYLAQVTQRTGEDWPEVELTLSTARPALTGKVPELNPWSIGPPRALPKPVARRAKMMTLAAPAAPMPAAIEDAVASGAVEEAPEPERQAQAVQAEVDTSGAAVTYKVPGTVGVPADGAPHKVTVAQYQLEPEMDYVTAPKLVQAAYRRAKLVNKSAYTLLPGKANVYAGDEFVGVTQLELTAPNGEIELYLGVDDRVKVERELARREVDKKLVGDRRRLRYGYEITLKNLLDVEAKVTVHDQIPVSRHENVKVKLESAEPKPAEQTEMGLLDWEFDLPPGGEQAVHFSFAVEHPRGMSVMGLP
jgi:uncharacterized protein (TIGR02231 family)